jgi:hypothetical protein
MTELLGQPAHRCFLDCLDIQSTIAVEDVSGEIVFVHFSTLSLGVLEFVACAGLVSVLGLWSFMLIIMVMKQSMNTSVPCPRFDCTYDIRVYDDEHE